MLRPCKSRGREAKEVCAVALRALKLEMNPAEYEREGDERRDHAAPHDERVHQPAR